MNTLFQCIPTTEGVRKVGPGQGERFDIAGAHLTWKVKGEESGYAFSICEQTLAPGKGFLSIAMLPPRHFMYSPVRPISFG